MPPLLTSESVLSEACFLLQVTQGRPEWVLDLVARKAIRPVSAMDFQVYRRHGRQVIPLLSP